MSDIPLHRLRRQQQQSRALNDTAAIALTPDSSTMSLQGGPRAGSSSAPTRRKPTKLKGKVKAKSRGTYQDDSEEELGLLEEGHRDEEDSGGNELDHDEPPKTPGFNQPKDKSRTIPFNPSGLCSILARTENSYVVR